MAAMTDKKGRKKIFCNICSTFISSETLLVMHNNGKKHQRLLRVLEERRASTERSIYVRGFENTSMLESKLNDYFSHFGKVCSIFVDKEKAKYAIIEFECGTVAEKVLNSNPLPLFCGKHLIIKKRTLKEPVRGSPKQTSKSKKANENILLKKSGCFLDEELINKIKYATTLDEQVSALVSSTSLSDDDSKLRSLIIQYLQEIFIEIFPGCVVTPFGSTVTGLGLKGADIDLCLLVDPESLKLVLDKEESSQSDLTGKVLEFIANVLRQFAAGFQSVVWVATAKCPVVKFVHRDSGLACDLSVNNRLAIRNSELIKSYVGLDDRIRPLAITLKNWGSAKHLTGSGGHQISNYCLVLMLLHFLQRVHPAVVFVLQLLCENEAASCDDMVITNKMIIDGWDCSFTSTTTKMVQNKETIGTLLKEWFRYYGTTFDYANEVITIRNNINEPLLKTVAEKSVSLDGGRSTLFKPSVLSVQDPFELSHNLTQNVSMEVLQRFIQACKAGYTILSNVSDQTMDGCSRGSDGFIDLFTLPTDVTQRPKKSFYSFTIPYISGTTNVPQSSAIPCSLLHQTCQFIVELLTRELKIVCDFQSDKETSDFALTDRGILPPACETGDKELSEGSMCVDEDIVTESFSLTSRKRAHVDEKPTFLGGVKRMKTDNKNATFTFLCRATEITWQNRRRQRRVQGTYIFQNEKPAKEEAGNSEMGASDSDRLLRNESRGGKPQFSLQTISDGDASTSCMSLASVGHTSINDVPFMKFKLTVSEHTESTLSSLQNCKIVLTHLAGSSQHFANFYAFFKKYVVQKIAERE